jgi:hypothetical protein
LSLILQKYIADAGNVTLEGYDLTTFTEEAAMEKTVYGGGALIALALIAGSMFIPTSFVMVLASTSLVANIARGIVVALMIALIVTNPPRSEVFRTILGTASFGFAYWALMHTLSGTIQLADSVLYLVAAIAFAIEALEINYVEELPPKIKAKTSLKSKTA